jgi:hypothetical protein
MLLVLLMRRMVLIDPLELRSDGGGVVLEGIDHIPLVADHLIAERTSCRVEILGTDDGQKLLRRYSNRKKQINVDASIGEPPESLRTGPCHVFHADSEGRPLVILDIGALKRGPGTPLVVSDERNRARVAVCRATHDDVHAMSSHSLTETGQLTGPIVELDSERTHVVLLSAPHDWKQLPVERTRRDVG